MKYIEFEDIMSKARMHRYLIATGNNSRKAMTLYRKNLRLSQEMFTIISCFEVAIRNKINDQYTTQHGSDWLKHSVTANGIFTSKKCANTNKIISKSLKKLTIYTHSKLLATLDFGFWRYLFAQPQYYAGGQTLLKIFLSKPKSTPTIQYNQSYIFNQLKLINDFRNRIAHHEPICFQPGSQKIDTTNALQHYNLIIQLFQWMNINESALLYGLDHVSSLCNEIDNL
ncbi:Abi family protein [Myroides phaeus]|uniref:Abi family protein n=1 Tax=Myroides phaeus TaxID=702745 RepID=UPI00130363AF|nr:Abi family protein [Myroides phaeus]